MVVGETSLGPKYGAMFLDTMTSMYVLERIDAFFRCWKITGLDLEMRRLELSTINENMAPIPLASDSSQHGHVTIHVGRPCECPQLDPNPGFRVARHLRREATRYLDSDHWPKHGLNDY